MTAGNVVICGAGIAGISAAYHLAVWHSVEDVILVDERPPLSLTSDKSTECYRNWWPGPGDAMVSLMNRSIDLLEELARETDNAFHLNRRGYLFVTADRALVPDLKRIAEERCALGIGPLRVHSGGPDDPVYVPAPAQGFEGLPTGADLMLDPALINQHFSFLSARVVAALHVRRCGWMSAQQLGAYWLEKARERGVRLLRARVEGVDVSGGRVRAVHLSGEAGAQTVSMDNFVIAAGPFTKQVGDMLGLDLPIFCELHPKIAFRDYLNVVSRNAPLFLWADPQMLPWSEQDRALLAESEQTQWMLEPFPPGPHGRPEGGSDSPMLLTLWTYEAHTVEPVWPPTFDPAYADVVLRGLSRMVPGLQVYFDRAARPVIDGGYYAKTRENRPLIGPLPVEGAFIIGALSGFGIMAACASGELLAAHMTGGELPPYAPWFLLERYEDPEYQKLLQDWDDSGQL
jgi:glycine/D-amino acid oxidase-like deaminating enzyme